MLERVRASGILWITVFALPALAVLIGLGTWQMQRKAWKDMLQTQIDTRAACSPRALSTVLEEGRQGQDVAYTRVRLKGTYRHEAVLFYYAPAPLPGGLGWHAYTPMQLGDGRWVFVNRGFIPDQLKPREQWSRWQPGGEQEITGLVRPPGEAGTFTPANSPAQNIWYWRDLEGMKTAVFGATASPAVVPYFVDAERTPAAASPQWPRPGTTNTNLVNRHLEYALTWYGLALTLVGVWGALAWSRLSSGRNA